MEAGGSLVGQPRVTSGSARGQETVTRGSPGGQWRVSQASPRGHWYTFIRPNIDVTGNFTVHKVDIKYDYRDDLIYGFVDKVS